MGLLGSRSGDLGPGQVTRSGAGLTPAGRVGSGQTQARCGPGVGRCLNLLYQRRETLFHGSVLMRPEISASNYGTLETLPWLRGSVFQVWWLRLSKPGFVFPQRMNSSSALPAWCPAPGQTWSRGSWLLMCLDACRGMAAIFVGVHRQNCGRQKLAPDPGVMSTNPLSSVFSRAS